MKLKILDLFSGLGGFSLGLERTGHFKTVAFCDNDKFSNLVLQKHWKGVKIYNNVKEITKERLEADGIESPDIITGGFPCQPFSVAGKQKGTSDDRHLWPEMFRIIKAFKPRFVIGENVPGIVNIQDGVVFETVCTDLESQGYEVQPFNIPAAAVGAPHQRKRIWIIASLENPRRTLRQGSELFNTNEDEVGKENANQHQRSSSSSESNVANTDTRLGEGENVTDTKSISSDVGEHREHQEKRSGQGKIRRESSEELANTNSERLEGLRQSSSQFNETSSSTSRSEERQGQVDQGWWSVEPNVGRVAHGVSGRVHRLRGLGNSIVPQIAEEIGRAIIKAENETQ
mgnify:CR=1 FL=1